MNCEWVQERITLYLYQELSESEQETLERHTAACESCADALRREQNFLRALSERPAMPERDSLLAASRRDLMRSVRRLDGSHAPQGPLSWWRDLEASLAAFWRPAWQPVMACALLLMGFSVGRLWQPDATPSDPVRQASLLPGAASEASLAGIQSVSVDPEHGGVEIVVEEVIRRTISGQPTEPRIRGLLLSAVKSYPNSGLRLDTLDVLARRVEDPEVRRTLLEAMVEDENAGVRLRALDALRSHKEDPEVRQSLILVLRQDSNPGMRVHAIDLLTENPDRDLVGAFQDLMGSERNAYVRMQFSRTLQDLNASVDRF